MTKTCFSKGCACLDDNLKSTSPIHMKFSKFICYIDVGKTLYPLDSIQWILYISPSYVAATALPLQCVERFHRYRSNKKNIIASLLKIAGFIHNHKVLPGNIFGRILKYKMATRDVYSTLSKDFCWPSRAKGIIGRDLKFAGYVPHYKILTGNIFGLILKNHWLGFFWCGQICPWTPPSRSNEDSQT